MRLLAKIALVIGALALATGPAAMAAGKPDGVPKGKDKGGQTTAPEYTPGDKATPPTHAKAYGWRCREESRKRVEGDTQKGTPFSQCVRNLKQAANHPNMAPGRVCKDQKVSRKREKDDPLKGTPFSRCVHDVVAQRKQERQEEKEEEETTEDSTETTTA